MTFHGRWHELPDVGLNPLPVQRPIPIWLGGHADPVLRRIFRMGDGWFPNYRDVEQARPSLEKLDIYLAENNRSRSDIGIEARLQFKDGNPELWHNIISGWQEEGATHFTLNTMGAGLQTTAEHMQAIRKFMGSVP